MSTIRTHERRRQDAPRSSATRRATGEALAIVLVILAAFVITATPLTLPMLAATALVGFGTAAASDAHRRWYPYRRWVDSGTAVREREGPGQAIRAGGLPSA